MNPFKHHIETHCLIKASPDRVWAALVDSAAIPSWNPFVRRMVGPLVEGGTIEVLMQPANSKPQTFRPKILKAAPGEELRWLGKVLVRGLLDAEHYFLMRPEGVGATRFVHGELFSGLLVPATRRFLERTQDSFIAMNAALAQHAEDEAA